MCRKQRSKEENVGTIQLYRNFSLSLLLIYINFSIHCWYLSTSVGNYFFFLYNHFTFCLSWSLTCRIIKNFNCRWLPYFDNCDMCRQLLFLSIQSFYSLLEQKFNLANYWNFSVLMVTVFWQLWSCECLFLT